MCGLFLFTLVCGRHENEVGEFRIFWDFWELWGGMKNFWFFGKFEFFVFQKGCRSLHILF